MSDYPLPSYLKLFNSGELHHRAEQLLAILDNCELCPRKCRVNRTDGQIGHCRSRYLPLVSSYTAHYGEEPVISGTEGSGTIFFYNCNLKCVFCQNFQISQPPQIPYDKEIAFVQLADYMIELQHQGCHNINFVSPTHFVPQIVKSLCIAVKKGLKIPLVYNTNGYENAEILRMLDGIIDVYLPDFKYADNSTSNRLSGCNNYFEIAKESISEMFRQVGLMKIDNDIIRSGLIIRHLILPNRLSGTEKVLSFVCNNLSNKVPLSLMSQYYPTHKAKEHDLVSRSINDSEYNEVLELLDTYDIEDGWLQSSASQDYYRPDFTKDVPFTV